MRALNAMLLFFAFVLPANPALAQPAPVAMSAPRIDGFDVAAARRLTTGTSLPFTLYGTPGGSASVHVNGAAARILLDEVEAGVYEGTYTIKKNDRIAANSTVTANLRQGNQIATAILDESLLAGVRSAAAPSAAVPAAAGTPRIERFEVDPPARLQAGEQLYFTLYGTPGGKASMRIAGVQGRLFMEEVQSGIYEEAYTIKERDRITANAAVTATLHLGNRDASATLGRPLLAGSNLGPNPGPAPVPSPRRAASACANCGVVEAVNVVEVKGEGTYLGKIGGGVVGGLLGSQIGHGKTTTLAEIAGAVGGALAGNEAEKYLKKTKHYDVAVRLQGGGAQTVTYATQPAFRVGDRVRIENGVLVSNL